MKRIIYLALSMVLISNQGFSSQSGGTQIASENKVSELRDPSDYGAFAEMFDREYEEMIMKQLKKEKGISDDFLFNFQVTLQKALADLTTEHRIAYYHRLIDKLDGVAKDINESISYDRSGKIQVTLFLGAVITLFIAIAATNIFDNGSNVKSVAIKTILSGTVVTSAVLAYVWVGDDSNKIITLQESVNKIKEALRRSLNSIEHQSAVQKF